VLPKSCLSKPQTGTSTLHDIFLRYIISGSSVGIVTTLWAGEPKSRGPVRGGTARECKDGLLSGLVSGQQIVAQSGAKIVLDRREGKQRL
jgi:hypothetical protein